MPHSVGAHNPTNIARRSALPRSSWSTVFARIHRLMHSATDPTDSAWTWLSRTPERWSVLMITKGVCPRGGVSHIPAGGTRLAVPRRQSLRRRLLTATAWPVGVTLTSWHYMWRTTPIHRRELPGSADDGPPPIPVTLAHEELQRPTDGVGPLFRRRYTARVRDADLSPEQLIARVGEDPNRASPTEFARFQKVRGDEGVLRAGDEFVVRMPGPWDGPVRVAEVSPTSFRLATLAGHLEAGRIEFRAFPDGGEL